MVRLIYKLNSNVQSGIEQEANVDALYGPKVK